MNIMWSISLFALMSDFRFLLINSFMQFLCFFYHLGNILINEPKLKQSYIKSKVAVMIAVLAPLVLQSTDQLFSLRNDAICSVLDLLKGNHWCLIFTTVLFLQIIIFYWPSSWLQFFFVVVGIYIFTKAKVAEQMMYT